MLKVKTSIEKQGSLNKTKVCRHTPVHSHDDLFVANEATEGERHAESTNLQDGSLKPQNCLVLGDLGAADANQVLGEIRSK